MDPALPCGTLEFSVFSPAVLSQAHVASPCSLLAHQQMASKTRLQLVLLELVHSTSFHRCLSYIPNLGSMKPGDNFSLVLSAISTQPETQLRKLLFLTFKFVPNISIQINGLNKMCASSNSDSVASPNSLPHACCSSGFPGALTLFQVIVFSYPLIFSSHLHKSSFSFLTFSFLVSCIQIEL